MLETPLLDHGSACSAGASSSPLDAFGAGNFVAGDENRIAETAAALLVENRALSPLVFYGPSGVGKTLLAHEIVGAWHAARPEDVVISLTGAEFAGQYAAAVDADEIDLFHRRFHDVDLLVVDGLQQLSSKPAAQWELLQILDVLESRSAAVVATLDVAPTQADALPAPLSARLVAGTVVAVAPPSTAARRRILERLAARSGNSPNDDALELLAADRSRSAAEICGLYLSLRQAAAAEGRTLDAAAVREALQRGVDGDMPTLKRVAEEAARQFGLTIADLKSHSRRRTVVAARDAAMLTARRLTGLTLTEIGQYFGRRDHTTVLHGCRKLEAALDADAEVRRMLEQLLQAVKEN